MGNTAADIGLDVLTGGAGAGGAAVLDNTIDSGKPGAQPNGFQPWQQAAGPSIFDTYSKLLPTEFGQAKPITNPDAILAAYRANLPQILQSSATTRPTDINPFLPNQR